MNFLAIITNADGSPVVILQGPDAGDVLWVALNYGVSADPSLRMTFKRVVC